MLCVTRTYVFTSFSFLRQMQSCGLSHEAAHVPTGEDDDWEPVEGPNAGDVVALDDESHASFDSSDATQEVEKNCVVHETYRQMV